VNRLFGPGLSRDDHRANSFLQIENFFLSRAERFVAVLLCLEKKATIVNIGVAQFFPYV
jgi:hypothetical protein